MSERSILTWSGYNNSGIAALAIGMTLNHCHCLSLSKALLIMPIAMHTPTIKYLANGNTRSREISSLSAVRPDFVHNFNQRYHASLTHTINGLQILHALGLISYDGSISQIKKFETSSILGKRAELISSASKEISLLLKSSEEELYLNLRVQL
ncbi:three component ABC system middle component [Pseudomonas sp. B11(2017)]|uniref:three component ABC system middle component n=1 Tax=Pseudomonas sp. B11(2017) TaxID=1981748 RepID=UPI0021147BD3|nr:three component ABC system middle component [Pseudomonas sp. B11(2017)]